ncbi:T6SS amidase immunity protein Tai4 family protein [Pseudomonas cerasi]
MDFKVIAALLLLSFPAISQDHQRDAGKYNLENFALSQCLANGFSDKSVKEDALAAVGAYVELGSYPAEAYEEATDLVHQFLNKKYVSKEGHSELIVMKCIDLSRSNELMVIKQKYAHSTTDNLKP